jgi:hypothetical protein
MSSSRHTFNTSLIDAPLFYNWVAKGKYGIRFHLSDSGISILNIAEAYVRCHQLFEDVFTDAKTIRVVLRMYESSRRRKKTGVYTIDSNPKKFRPQIHQDLHHLGDEVYMHDYVFDLPKSNEEIEYLLWSSVCKDSFTLHTGLNARIFFLEKKKNIIFHCYDNRGLDVVSDEKEPLLEIYRKHKKEILTANRKDIDRLFAHR